MSDNYDTLREELALLEKRLADYEELLADQLDDDPAYVARGNGFCDAKYSSDFLEGQISSLRSRINTLRETLAKGGSR